MTSSIKKVEENIYYSVTIPHNDLTTIGSSPTLANFYETRSQPIVDNPSAYRLSVTRMEVPGDTIPIFIMPVQPNPVTPSDPNYTIFSVTVIKGSTVVTGSQQFLEYLPRDQTQTVPPAPTLGTPPIRPQYYLYYSLYDYQTLVDMFNTAFANAFSTLSAITSTMPPIMTYNPVTQLFSIYIQQSYIADNINVYFNVPSANLFLSTLELINKGYTQANGLNFQLVIENTYTNIVNAPLFDPTHNYYVFTQQYSNVNTPVWQALTQIVITSDIPTLNQLMPNINTNGVLIQQTQNNFKPVLTDFNVVGQNYRQGIVYNPTAQYRYLTLQGTSALSTVNIQIYWVDNYQNYFPVTLSAHQSAN